MNDDSFYSYPTRTYKWGVIALEGKDHNIVSTFAHRYYKTQKLARMYARETFHAYLICQAYFP